MAVIGVALLAAVTIAQTTTTSPAAAPLDTTTWLSAAAGDTVIVTGTAGRELRGDVVGLTPDTLSVLTAGVRLDIDRRDVLGVRRRFEDPVRDGALKGAAAGAGAATFLFVLAAPDLVISGLSDTATLAVMGGIFSLSGMWIGRAVDGMVTQESVIYRTPTRPRTTFAPLLSRDAVGAGLAVAW